MNEALMTALAETLTAAEEALDAAQAGRFDEAQRLLVIVDEGIESGQGGTPPTPPAAARSCASTRKPAPCSRPLDSR